MILTIVPVKMCILNVIYYFKKIQDSSKIILCYGTVKIAVLANFIFFRAVKFPNKEAKLLTFHPKFESRRFI